MWIWMYCAILFILIVVQVVKPSGDKSMPFGMKLLIKWKWSKHCMALKWTLMV